MMTGGRLDPAVEFRPRVLILTLFASRRRRRRCRWQTFSTARDREKAQQTDRHSGRAYRSTPKSWTFAGSQLFKVRCFSLSLKKPHHRFPSRFETFALIFLRKLTLK